MPILTLPTALIIVIWPFAQAFSKRIWESAQVLLIGAILAPGKRTVTAVLQVLGLKAVRSSRKHGILCGLALSQYDGSCVSAVEHSGLGTTFLNGLSVGRKDQRAQRAASQDQHCLDWEDDHRRAPLVARASVGVSYRWGGDRGEVGVALCAVCPACNLCLTLAPESPLVCAARSPRSRRWRNRAPRSRS